MLLTLLSLNVFADTHTLTLRQVIDQALAQNPDLVLARLDQAKARSAIQVAKDPFSPKIYAGSGAAYTTGYPANIQGEAPSIFQIRTQMQIFDRPQSYQIAEANENLRGAEIDVARQQEDVAYRVASLYLDAEQAARSLDIARRQTETAQHVLEIMQTRAGEGRELPIEVRKASVAVSRAKLAVDGLESDLANAESALAMALGLAPGDRVKAAQEERAPIAVPPSEEQSVETAIQGNLEVRRLESSMQAKRLDIKSFKAQRLPKASLIAQDEVFAKYYFQDYYQKFSRTSAQFGASIEVPVWVGKAARAYISQDEADIEKLRVQIAQVRGRVSDDVRRAYQDARHAEMVRDVARDDLALAREQVNVDLAQNEEGRLAMSALEQARTVENEKWLAYYEAQHLTERARLNVLHRTGTLVSALR
jgi:outer membrane protein TolC